MKFYLYGLFSLILMVSLCGCGGGGGGDSPTINFQSWSSIKPPVRVEIKGLSQNALYGPNGNPPPNSLVDDRGVSTNSSATIKYRSNGTIELIEIKTPYVSLKWSEESRRDLINDDTEWIYAINSPGTEIAALSNPYDSDTGWEYQTFGVWGTGRGLDRGTIGSLSVGAPTAASAIPTTSVATFTGNTSGIYINAAGEDYFAYSTLTVDVDFENRSMLFDSSDTERIPVDDTLTGVPTSAPVAFSALDWSGSISYQPDQNAFSGAIATGAALDLDGSTTGQFYGPNAEELGGVFSMSNTSDPTSPLYYSGAYGAAAPSVP